MDEHSARNIFIVNPKAGQGKGNVKFTDHIKQEAEALGIPVEIYMTAGVGDAEILARQIASEVTTPTRIYACGGDGTMNEVLNGAIDNENIAVGLLPIGTGNDFCRNFPEAGDFLDIAAQLQAVSEKCDAIRYTGKLAGEEKTRYCANMFNIGFDCNVVDLTATMKTYPLISGSFAYLMSVATMVVKKKGANLKVEVDGEVRHDGPLLLTAVANGCFCGGGVKSSPEARTDDGLMDYNIIRDVKRTEFIKLFPKYAKGTHTVVPGIERILDTGKAKKIAITPNEGVMRLCTDGEIVDAGRVEMEIVPSAFNFLVPPASK